MQVEGAQSDVSAKPQPFLTDNDLTKPEMTTKTFTAFVDHPSEWNTTGTMPQPKNFTETASLLISNSMSTSFDKKVAVRLSNSMESPCTIRKETQITEFSVVTPEQSKFIEPVDTTILSMITEERWYENDPSPEWAT